MTINQGYDNKPTHIKVYPTSGTQLAVWIEQKGLVQLTGGRTKRSTIQSDGKILEKKDDIVVGHSETLAHMTLDEAVKLIYELQAAIMEVVSGKRGCE